MEAQERLKKKGSICFVAGRSGGHIVPCLTRAAEIKKRYPNFSISLFTTRHVLDMAIAQQCKIPLHHIPLQVGSVPKKNPFKLALFLIHLLYAFFKSMFVLKRNRTQQVVTTGSYIAIPVCLAAWVLKIPIELHILDIVPGKALLFLAPLAQSISLCFAESASYFPNYTHKCYQGRYPIRFEKLKRIQQSATLQRPFTILVLGGSQGSEYLNQLMTSWAQRHGTSHKKNVYIIHQTGSNKDQDVAYCYKTAGVKAFVFDYRNDLEHFLTTADLVICRSGAGTLFEIDFFKVPCITIPLITKTTAHQVDNARSFAARFPERFVHLEQKDDVNSMSNHLNTIIQKWIS